MMAVDPKQYMSFQFMSVLLERASTKTEPLTVFGLNEDCLLHVQPSVPDTASHCSLGATTLPMSTFALAVLAAAAPDSAAALTGTLPVGGARCGEPMRTLSSAQLTSDGPAAAERGSPHSPTDGQGRADPAPVTDPSLLVAPSNAERGDGPVATARVSVGAAQRGRPRQGPASIRTLSGTCPHV